MRTEANARRNVDDEFLRSVLTKCVLNTGLHNEPNTLHIVCVCARELSIQKSFSRTHS